MDLNLAMSDPRWGYELAWALNELYAGPNLGLVNNTMRGTIGEDTTAQEWPVTDLVPSVAIFKGPSVTVVLMQGIRTYTQVGALVLSWIEDRNLRENSGFARVADRVADVMIQRLGDFNALDNSRYILAGHSYGGMCLQSLASKLAARRATNVVSLATFGSPKGGDDRLAHSMQRVDLCRYMNVGDNIPFAPPISDQAPLMHLLLTRHESLSINQLVLVGQGKVLADTGAITDGGYPPLPGIFADLSIANFLVNNSAPVAVAHRLAEYVRRLRLYVDNNPVQPARQRGVAQAIGEVEPIAVPPIPAVDVWVDNPGATLRRRGNLPLNQIPDPVAIGDAAGNPINPQREMGPGVPVSVNGSPVTAYRTRKIGRAWVVYYVDPDNIVLVGNGRGHAKRFAARMNSALNAWNRSTATDEGAFEQSAIDAFN